MEDYKLNVLPRSLSNFVRASSNIPAFKNVVEELVLNSIDAAATTIDIYINSSNYVVEVVDDGVGIPYKNLKDQIGNWNISNKCFYDGAIQKSSTLEKYGFRGEALASINELSRLEVFSKTKKSPYGYNKNCSLGTMTQSKCQRNGTTVIVKDLFHNMTVRRKCSRDHLEILRIKQFLIRMILLHHHINWKFTDTSSNKVILNMKSVESVAGRFIEMHDISTLHKMKEVSITSGNYMISGLISPLNTTACHHNKECQYLYINNRWIKHNDIITAYINSTYLTLLAQRNTSGPVPKHFISGQTSVLYPCFVLNFHCQPQEYDVLSDPDKSTVVFQLPDAVLRCVSTMIDELIRTYNPEMMDQYKDLLATSSSFNSSGGMTGVTWSSRQVNQKLDVPTTQCESPSLVADTIFSPALCSGSSGLGHRTEMFTLACDYSSSGGGRLGTDSDSFLDINYSNIFLSSSDDSPGRNAVADEEPADTSVLHRTGLRTGSEFGVTVHRQRNLQEAYFDQQLCLASIDLEDNFLSVTGSHQDRDRRGAEYECPSSPAVSTSIDLLRTEFEAELHDSLTSKKYFHTQQQRYKKNLSRPRSAPARDPGSMTTPDSRKRGRFDEFRSPDTTDFPTAFGDGRSSGSGTEKSARSPERLFRSDTSSGRTNAGSHVQFPSSLCEDEEDADFRGDTVASNDRNTSDISTSRLWTDKQSTTSTFTLRLPITLSKADLMDVRAIGQVGSSYILCVTKSDQLLCVDQHAADERVQLEHLSATVTSSASNNFPAAAIQKGVAVKSRVPSVTEVSLEERHILESQCDFFEREWGFYYTIDNRSLRLSRTLSVFGENLTVQDLLEFVRTIRDAQHCAMTIFAPPAVSRICVSKACRSAIKFGSRISLTKCQEVMDALACTSMPFQCAHGRPSVTPLVTAAAPGESSSRLTKPSYYRLFL